MSVNVYLPLCVGPVLLTSSVSTLHFEDMKIKALACLQLNMKPKEIRIFEQK